MNAISDTEAAVERQRADNSHSPMPDSAAYDDLGIEIEVAEVLCRKVQDAISETVPTDPSVKDALVLAGLLARQIEAIDTAARQVRRQMEKMHRQEATA